MPNWCNNWTHFRHADREQVVRLKKAFEDKRPFQEFVPCPQELIDTVSGFPGDNQKAAHDAQVAANIEKYGHADWYSWCTSNWGTKWDTESYAYDELNIDEGDDGLYTLSVSFDTAWSPPTQFYEHMAEQGWLITGYFIEWGMNFCGLWDEGGEESFEIPETPEEAEDVLPYDLEEVFDICQTLADRREELAEQESEQEDS